MCTHPPASGKVNPQGHNGQWAPRMQIADFVVPHVTDSRQSQEMRGWGWSPSALHTFLVASPSAHGASEHYVSHGLVTLVARHAAVIIIITVRGIFVVLTFTLRLIGLGGNVPTEICYRNFSVIHQFLLALV